MTHGDRATGIETAINILTLIIASLILFVTVDSSISDREERRDQTCRKLTSLVNLAVDDISRALGGARESLRLLSRMPALRETRSSGRLSPVLTQFTDEVTQAGEGLEIWMTRNLEVGQDKVNRVNGYLDLTRAGMRRGFLEIGIRNPVDGADAEQSPWLICPSPTFCRGLLGWAQRRWQLFSNVWLSAGQLLDGIFPLGEMAPFDVVEIQRLLNASLSDKDLIRAVAVKNMDGKELVSVTEIGASNDLFLRWGSSAQSRSGRPYYPGPVWFHEGLGRPLWQLALPLRDKERNAFALLTSQIDLGFLSEIVSKSRTSSASYLFIVDEEGIVISHPKSTIVTNQVNVSRSNPAVAEVLTGADGFREVTVGGSSYFAAFRQLKNMDSTSLPGWGILYMTPVSEVLPDPALSFLSFLFWTGLVFYGLYLLNNYILLSLEEQWEA